MIEKSEVERIKSQVDLAHIIGPYIDGGLRRMGADLKGLCPFHEEKTASFIVHPEYWKCHGCGEGGDVFKFFQKLEGLAFPQAVKRVAELAGLTVNESRSYRPAPANRRTEPSPQTPDDPELEARVDRSFQKFGGKREMTLEQWRPYAEALMDSGAEVVGQFPALRGITGTTVEKFKLGYAATGEKIVGSNPEYAEYRDKPWIGFPYIYGDRVRMVKWRTLFSVGKKFARPASMAECLYIDGEPDPFDDVVLQEGELDALTLWQAGIRAASLPSGSNSRITKEMRDWLLGFRRILIGMDNDEAGQLALRKILMDLPVDRTAILTLPDGWKDANEMLVKGCGRDKDKFREEIQQALAAAARPTSVAFSSLDQAFDAYLRKLMKADGKEEVFFQFPWRSVDRMIRVIPGEVIALSSTTSGQGKTTFAVQCALHNARHLRKHVGYYTAEMDAVEELVPMVTAQLVKQNRLDLDVGHVEEAKMRCEGAEFYFGYDREAENWTETQRVLDLAVRRLGLDILIIDHLDYIIRVQDFREEIQQKAMAMKWLTENLAKKYGIVVVVLRQPTKIKSDTRRKDEPMAAENIQGGVAGITDAQHVILIHRKRVSTNEEQEDGGDIYERETSVIRGKTRHAGPGGAVVKLILLGQYACFERLEREDQKKAEPKKPKAKEATVGTASLPYKD